MRESACANSRWISPPPFNDDGDDDDDKEAGGSERRLRVGADSVRRRSVVYGWACIEEDERGEGEQGD